jgi:hypothetical protein
VPCDPARVPAETWFRHAPLATVGGVLTMLWTGGADDTAGHLIVISRIRRITSGATSVAAPAFPMWGARYGLRHADQASRTMRAAASVHVPDRCFRSRTSIRRKLGTRLLPQSVNSLISTKYADFSLIRGCGPATQVGHRDGTCDAQARASRNAATNDVQTCIEERGGPLTPKAGYAAFADENEEVQVTEFTGIFTKTDLATGAWGIDDDVVQLREWGPGTIHPLPASPMQEATIGAAESCTFQLRDPSTRVSRLHARVTRNQTKWLLRDEHSKNGITVDGLVRREIVLEPGIEIGIGGIVLIAESRLSAALRGFLARLLGWSSAQTENVDHALRSVRMAAMRRAALVLCGGDGDLVPIANAIHRRTRGRERPFIVCDPRRHPGKATVRSAASRSTGREALALAVGGSLCLRSRRLPPDFHELAEALRAPVSQVQLIVCAEAPADWERCRVTPIVIPPLASRGAELDRIIEEYAEDAMTELETSRSTFLAIDHAWVREQESESLPDIEKATLRLVALRASRNVNQASSLLGMAPVSLGRWIGRRKMPMQINK